MSDQIYLGCANGFVLCIDSYKSYCIEGRMYHLYDKEPILIKSYKDLFLKGEQFFNMIGRPYADCSDHDFSGNIIEQHAVEEVQIMNQDQDILKEQGEEDTFIVRVTHRAHASWQGRVTWVATNQTQVFRSELELMKLIDHALNQKAFISEEEV